MSELPPKLIAGIAELGIEYKSQPYPGSFHYNGKQLKVVWNAEVSKDLVAYHGPKAGDEIADLVLAELRQFVANE